MTLTAAYGPGNTKSYSNTRDHKWGGGDGGGGERSGHVSEEEQVQVRAGGRINT